MISIWIIIGILLIHWFNDFVMQSHWMASNKSKSNQALVAHTATYSALWVVPAILVLGYHGILFIAVTFVAHSITDYYTSRRVSKLFAKQDYHNGFVVIGIDQILHYLQLIGSYLWLSSII